MFFEEFGKSNLVNVGNNHDNKMLENRIYNPIQDEDVQSFN